MKICPYCGSEQSADHVKFCGKCGKQFPEQQIVADSNSSVKKKAPLPLIIGVAAIVLLLLILIVSRSSYISLGKYMEGEVSGYNGYGVLYVGLDKEGLLRAINKNIPMSKYDKNNIDSMLDDLVSEIHSEKLGGFKNGDKVQLTIDEQSSVFTNFQSYGVKLRPGKKTIKVKGLKKTRNYKVSNNYLEVGVSGYKGEPVISYQVDWDGFSEDFHSKMDKYIEDEDTDVTAEAYQFLEDELKVESEPNLISVDNGDTIKVSLEQGESDYFATRYGITFEGTEIKVQVQGLMDRTEIDLADLLEVRIDGIEPYLYLDVTLDEQNPASQIIESYYPEIGPFYGHNGDTLVINIDYDSDLSWGMGYMVTNSEKAFTISGIESYQIDSSDLTDAYWEEELKLHADVLKKDILRDSDLLKHVNEIFEDDAARILWNYLEVTPYEVINGYEEHEDGSGNIVSLIYEVQFALMERDESVRVHKYYKDISMRNLKKDENGNLIDSEDYFRSGKDYYLSDQELSELEEQLTNALTDQGYGAIPVVKTSIYPAQDQAEIPETVEKTESEIAALLETVDVLEADSADAETENMASAVIEYDGRKYYRFDMPMTWEKAEAFCQERGYHLASVDDAKTQMLLAALIDGNNQSPAFNAYWVGAHYKGGQWGWSDDTDFSYNAWYEENPYRNEEENPYALISRSDRSMLVNAVNEAENVGFILETGGQDLANEAADYLESRRISEEENVYYSVADSYETAHYTATVLTDDNWERQRAVYELAGKYQSFSGRLYVGNDTQTEAQMLFAVFGDGKLLYRQAGINRQSKDISFHVDVTGVNHLSLKVRNLGGGHGYVLLDLGKLYPAETEDNSSHFRRFQEMTPIDSSEYSWNDEISYDAEGAIHDGSGAYNVNRNGFSVWNLESGFTHAEFNVWVLGGNADTAAVIRIYGDDILLDESEPMNQVSNKYVFPADLDLSEVRLMKIEVTNEGEGPEAYAYLSDDILYMK